MCWQVASVVICIVSGLDNPIILYMNRSWKRLQKTDEQVLISTEGSRRHNKWITMYSKQQNFPHNCLSLPLHDTPLPTQRTRHLPGSPVLFFKLDLTDCPLHSLILSEPLLLPGVTVHFLECRFLAFQDFSSFILPQTTLKKPKVEQIEGSFFLTDGKSRVDICINPLWWAGWGWRGGGEVSYWSSSLQITFLAHSLVVYKLIHGFVLTLWWKTFILPRYSIQTSSPCPVYNSNPHKAINTNINTCITETGYGTSKTKKKRKHGGNNSIRIYLIS